MGKHSAPRAKRWARPKWLVIAGATVVVAATAGGIIAYAATRGPSAAEKRAAAAAAAHARKVAEEAAIRQSQAQLVASLQISPVSGSTNVPLDASVSVSTASGSISTVKVVSASGSALAGSLSSSGEWVASGGLQPSTTYTITVAATGNGVSVDHTSTFSTLTPVETVSATVWPTPGIQVGVGQPIVLKFNHDVTDAAAQKAIESRLTVAMSQPVAGGWYWFSAHELHFRPQNFWPAHEQVQIAGDLAGINIGDGQWTEGTVSDSFTIGDARVSYANLQTEKMTVTLNGAVVDTFPISGGSTKYPTMNGVHIVLDRESVVHMVSSTVGIPVNSPNGYDELVYNDVHISDSGEYVHAAPWSVGDQGVTNVSHGCINLSNANSLTFFNFSRVGDVVEVTGSPRPAVSGDHGVMDWSGPAWTEWAPAHVTAIATAPATTTTVAAATTPATTAPASTTTAARATTEADTSTTAHR